MISKILSQKALQRHFETKSITKALLFTTLDTSECMVCHYWFFKDVGFKFEEHVCNGCHDLLTMAYSLENIAILSAKGATFRCILWGISRNEGLRRLNNSVLEDRGVL